MLDCDVPAILGMEFLGDVNPVIDWKTGYMRVPVGSRRVTVQLLTFNRDSE